jgi:hypothetical protein
MKPPGSSGCWADQGFKSLGVRVHGMTAIDVDGNARVIFPGEIDEDRR